MKKLLIFGLILVVGVVFVVVANKDKNNNVFNSRSDGRLLSVDLTEGDGGFEASLAAAKELHTQVVSLVVQWDELEKSPGTFDPLYLGAAKQVFTKDKKSVVLGLNPMDTLSIRTPTDLRSKKFNDPIVIERYKKAVDYYLSQVQGLEIVAFSIGNEIDGHLETNQTSWTEYQEFYKSVAPYVKSKVGSAAVSAKIMYAGLIGKPKKYALSFNEFTDAVFATYYPLNNDFTVKDPSVVRSDVDVLMNLYPNKPVYFLEFGYPSSTILGSSEDKQAVFVSEMFKTWDVYKDRIPIITFFGMSDITQVDLDRYVKYYGVGGNNFREYLGTLGLLNADGTRKKSFQVFKQEASSRGW